MGNNKERRHVSPENKRDTSADKKKIKRILIAIICIFAALGLLWGALALVAELIKPEIEDVSYDDFRFFEADYDADLLQNKMYLSLNRNIYYNRYGTENLLTEETAADIAPAAEFFYDYINCIIAGDYEAYPDFFTEKYLSDKNAHIPEKFTMQGLYDINIKLHSTKLSEESAGTTVEIYEVSYRIFENNGTFRRDILPDETRTMVFEVYIYGGAVKINAVANRANG